MTESASSIDLTGCDPRYLKNTPVRVEIVKLNKRFGDNHVLRDVDLVVEPGETAVIIGRSGGGKSVLLKHIIGLERPDSGTVKIAGFDAFSRELRERVRLAMVFQASALFGSMSVGENLSLWLTEHRICKDPEIVRSIVAQKLEMVGLEGKEEIMPSELSGGMKKRVAIARALVMNPDLILYDEPTSELDPLIAETISQVIMDLKQRLHITSLVVTHDIGLALYVADRIAMIHEGRIVEIGTPEQIKKSSNPIVNEFVSVQTKHL